LDASPDGGRVMRATFIHRDSILRDSDVPPAVPAEQWRVMPATLEAVRHLATDDMLVFLFGARVEGQQQSVESGLHVLARQIEAAGGRIDGLISCDHEPDDGCGCWGEPAGALWLAAQEFGLPLNECYLLGDTQKDVEAAYAAGVRPVISLCGRTIAEFGGRLPAHRDHPIASDLSTAVDYIRVEDEISRNLGHARTSVASTQPEASEPIAREALPIITVVSPMARDMQASLRASRTQLRAIARWLTFFVVGAVGLSLGIAYLLTHLYRVQPFPEFVYYLTLQFIPRPVRGGLFIAMGLVVILIAARSLYRSLSATLSRRRM